MSGFNSLVLNPFGLFSFFSRPKTGLLSQNGNKLVMLIWVYILYMVLLALVLLSCIYSSKKAFTGFQQVKFLGLHFIEENCISSILICLVFVFALTFVSTKNKKR